MRQLLEKVGKQRPTPAHCEVWEEPVPIYLQLGTHDYKGRLANRRQGGRQLGFINGMIITRKAWDTEDGVFGRLSGPTRNSKLAKEGSES